MGLIARVLLAASLFVALLHMVALIDGQQGIVRGAFAVVAEWWSANEKFLNSNFVTSVAGALAGAFFGAWGAQKIAERSKQKDDLVKEIRNVNAAITIAFGCSNIFISLKRQYVRGLKARFDDHLMQFVGRQAQMNTHGPLLPFVFQPDMLALSEIKPPLEMLQGYLSEKISSPARVLIALPLLAHSLENLNDALMRRNQSIDVIKKEIEKDISEAVCMYFGILSPKKRLEQTYSNLLTAIVTFTDDGIFYSNLIAKDLAEYGEKLRLSYKQQFGRDAPLIQKLRYGKEAAQEIPPDSTYAHIVANFGLG